MRANIKLAVKEASTKDHAQMIPLKVKLKLWTLAKIVDNYIHFQSIQLNF